MEETTNPAPTTRDVGIRYGLIMGVIGVIYFLVMTFAGVDMTGGPGRYASFIFLIIIFILAHKYFKDEGDGFMSFGQGFGIVFWISLVSNVISNLFFYIYVKFIDSGFIQLLKDKQMEEMANKGMSQEQIDQAMNIAGKFMTPEVMLGFGLVFGIIMYVICGIIITLFTQKKNPAADI
ncbi:MAG: DUF4199 domain-containing protein [Bacteroidetes bacterium]|nr:DUF4199 domain-containing protein [Bacteroidota bacterium]